MLIERPPHAVDGRRIPKTKTRYAAHAALNGKGVSCDPPALATVHGGKGLDGHIHKRAAGFAADERRQRDQRAGSLLCVGEVPRDWQDVGQPRACAELRREQPD